MDKELRQHLGRVVRENRKRLGLSQEQLGQMIGRASHNTISNIERGRTVPSLYRLSALSKVLGVPLWKFVTVENLVPATKAANEYEYKIIENFSRLTEKDQRRLSEIVAAFSNDLH
ncbi:helix-turn-helix transcriptional regulator [Aerophototrophica crusticola]|uniref:Helix-turn-helix transcriptional regulator n=1 Tax=Aerophototrophica crusticola TaxID=1709002 RepID=A0A858R4Q8_9PROT|nr:helix-turn-helix transcriptional regulator [Rhodospirillaceae bacterium B3]